MREGFGVSAARTPSRLKLVRRVVKLTLGVAFGVAIADFLVSVVRVGAWQAGLVVALAMALAVFLGREETGVKEATISAMIILITFPHTTPDSRWNASWRP